MNTIILNNQKVNYIEKKSSRAKSIRVSINGSGELILTLPKAGFFQSDENIKKKALKFLESKSDWILKYIGKKNNKTSTNPDLYINSRDHYLKYKEISRILCSEKCEYWAKKMGVKYNKISIKNLKTKWGSCSSRKNLNFNYKIIFLSEKDRNYLIVHELSHLVFMNHSSDFWNLVCETLGSREFYKYNISGNYT